MIHNAANEGRDPVMVRWTTISMIWAESPTDLPLINRAPEMAMARPGTKAITRNQRPRRTSCRETMQVELLILMPSPA